MFILILPFLIGAAARASSRRTKRAYLVTIGLIVLAAIAWAAAYAIPSHPIPSHGSELYGLIAFQATSAAAGASLDGLFVRLKRDG